jgi:peroxiredoxin
LSGSYFDRSEVSMRSAAICGALCIAAVLLASRASAETAGAVTLTGQVVCSECWFEEKDRKASPYGTDADLKCAVRCSKTGVPQALAVWKGDQATLYLLEKGSFEGADKGFLPYVGKEVEITGTVRGSGDKQYLKVDALEVVGAGPAAAAAPEPALGGQAPALALRDLSGQEQTLASYKGKVVVLNFWATWCVPCRKEMPTFVNLQGEYAAWGVQVIAASADTAETRDQVVKFVREKRLAFPVWTGATTDQMLAFGLGSELPGTAVIDREGRVVARYKGVVKEADLRKVIDGLLAADRPEGEGGDAVASAAKSSVPS